MSKSRKAFGLAKDRTGSGYIKIAIAVLVLASVFAAVFSYAEIKSTLEVIESNVKMTLDSVLMHRSAASFELTDDGDKGNFDFDESVFFDVFNRNFETLEEDGGMYVRYGTDGKTLWKMSKPEISTENVGEPVLVADFTVFIPIGAGGIFSDEMEINMHVKSTLTFAE